MYFFGFLSPKGWVWRQRKGKRRKIDKNRGKRLYKCICFGLLTPKNSSDDRNAQYIHLKDIKVLYFHQ